jgi:hypothetical protein
MITIQTVFILGVVLTIFLSNSNINQETYGHNFTPDESASFLAFTYQLQVESDLVKANLLTNDITLAQEHANKARSLITPTILAEIVEKDPKIANDLRFSVDDLKKVSSSIESEKIENTITKINSTLTKLVEVRLSTSSADSSNFFSKMSEFMTDLFPKTSDESDITTSANSTVLALSFADLVDKVLIDYGNAFAVEFDMTNMSNMAMMGDNSSMSSAKSGMNMDSMNISTDDDMTMTHDNHHIYPLKDISDYQSAQALIRKANDIFNSTLKPFTTNENHTDFFESKLYSALNQLDNSITNKDSPMDIMMIAHTKIHPNLLAIFNLDTRNT